MKWRLIEVNVKNMLLVFRTKVEGPTESPGGLDFLFEPDPTVAHFRARSKWTPVTKPPHPYLLP